MIDGMEYIGIINRIIEAEHSAQTIVGETRRQKDNLPEILAEEKRKLSEEYRQQADQQIKAYREEEEKQRDLQLDRLRQELSSELDRLDKRAASMKETWVSTLFAKVIGHAD
ncbi:MAG: hypothetical protein FWH49_09440 [Clostridiales bacterium]|nr:hypothetical protein [Clostridiales bacterium]MCL2167491.1 hypothetical protein [Clostridiales bacterium]